MLDRLRRFTAAGLVGLLLSCSMSASAASCNQRIRNAETQLDRAIKRFGRSSNQARAKQRQLDQVRAFCARPNPTPSAPPNVQRH